MTSEVERAKSLGVIKVVLTVGITGHPITLTPTNGFQNQEREIPEKALKGRELSHRGAYVSYLRLYHLKHVADEPQPDSQYQTHHSRRQSCYSGREAWDNLLLLSISRYESDFT